IGVRTAAMITASRAAMLSTSPSLAGYRPASLARRILEEAAPALAPEPARQHHLAQQRAGPVAVLLLLGEQPGQHRVHGVDAHEVGPLQRPTGIVGAQLQRRV